MPSNLYGVANAPNLWSYVGMGADVTPPPGVSTNIMDSGVMIAPSQGWYYPLVMFTISVVYGATLPTNVGFNFSIGSGSGMSGLAINNSIMVPSATQQYSYCFGGPPSSVPWITPGSHLFVTAQFNTTSATVSHFGSFAHFYLIRAPDQ